MPQGSGLGSGDSEAAVAPGGLPPRWLCWGDRDHPLLLLLVSALQSMCPW